LTDARRWFILAGLAATVARIAKLETAGAAQLFHLFLSIYRL
jgi:hypothetical protein